MSKRRLRTAAGRSHHTTTGAARFSLASNAEETHQALLKYLSQPALLLIGSLSKYWRALAMKESRFYLAARLDDVSDTAAVGVFLQRLDDAVRRQLPIGIYLNLEGPSDDPCAVSDAECDILAEKVSPAIKRAMPHVRKLSVVSGAPLPPATLEFLQARAPDLREFVFRIHMEMHTDETHFNGSKNYARRRDEAYNGHAANLEAVLEELFDRVSPKLTRVHLGGIVLKALPEDPVSVFESVTHVGVSDVAAFPGLGLGTYFPKAKHMSLELDESCVEDCEASGGPALLPARLATLDVWTVTAKVLCALLERADLTAVPDLRVAFDGHFENDDGSREARDAAWAGCCAARGEQRRLSMFSTSWDEEGMPQDLRVSVSDDSGARGVVTLYAEDSICAPHLYQHAPYGPLASLACISDNVTVISIEHAHLKAIFSITTATFPALRALRIAFRIGKPQRTAFWELGRFERYPLVCSALAELDIFSGSGIPISSTELASFARAIGLSDAHRPRLTLRGVTVEGGTHHIRYFSDADE